MATKYSDHYIWTRLIDAYERSSDINPISEKGGRMAPNLCFALLFMIITLNLEIDQIQRLNEQLDKKKPHNTYKVFWFPLTMEGKAARVAILKELQGESRIT